MKKTFLDEKFPYLFTILMALTTYQLNTLIGLEVNSPTLMYHFSTIAERVSTDSTVIKTLDCKIQNINRNKAFKDLRIHIRFRSDNMHPLPYPSLVAEPILIPIAPSPLTTDSPECIDNIANAYQIPIIHPNAEFILRLNTIQNRRINEYPKLYLYSKGDVRLIESGLETLLIEHQVFLNFFVLILCLSGVTVYFVFVIKHNSENK